VNNFHLIFILITNFDLIFCLGNKKVFFCSNSNFSFKGNEIPDGMTTDIRGNLWLVIYYGAKILNIDINTGLKNNFLIDLV